MNTDQLRKTIFKQLEILRTFHSLKNHPVSISELKSQFPGADSTLYRYANSFIRNGLFKKEIGRGSVLHLTEEYGQWEKRLIKDITGFLKSTFPVEFMSVVRENNENY